MNTNWMLQTHGDPLGALQKFVKMVWEQTNLDVMVVAPNGSRFLLETPDELEHMNPFRPLMKLNTARLVVDTAKKRPGKRIGAMLRPCEMRALNEMAARGALNREDVLVICTDCLGTFPADEFECLIPIRSSSRRMRYHQRVGCCRYFSRIPKRYRTLDS